MTTDLAAWLREQLDEDELVAKAAARGVADHCYPPALAVEHAERSGRWAAKPWVYHRRIVAGAPPGWEPRVVDSTWSEVAEHMVAHDPAHVLAEVEAKRLILDLVPDIKEAEDTARQDYGRDAKARLRLVQLLALPYADRPGYREEWRP